MSPTPSFPKLIQLIAVSGNANDPVTIINTRTGEIVTRDRKDNSIFRLDSRQKSIVFDLTNLVSGYLVGDVLLFSVGGAKATTVAVTVTAATNAPQKIHSAATAVSTGVLNI